MTNNILICSPFLIYAQYSISIGACEMKYVTLLFADFDECTLYGTCSQTCQNTEGSYVCRCVEGYLLQPDNKSCKAKNGNWQLILLTYGHFQFGFKKTQVKRFGWNITWTNKTLTYFSSIPTNMWICTLSLPSLFNLFTPWELLKYFSGLGEPQLKLIIPTVHNIIAWSLTCRTA